MWLLVNARSDTLAIEVSGDETVGELRSIIESDYGYETDFILAHRASAFAPNDGRTLRSAGLTNLTVLSLQEPNLPARARGVRPSAEAHGPAEPPKPTTRAQEPPPVEAPVQAAPNSAVARPRPRAARGCCTVA
jgi:hypothetical protein